MISAVIRRSLRRLADSSGSAKRDARRGDIEVALRLRRKASARSARRSASPASMRRRVRHLAASRPSCRCSGARDRSRPRSQPGCARPACRTRLPSKHRRSSAIHRNPIDPRITSPIIIADVVAGWAASMALNTTCAVMPSGRLDNGRNAAKSVASRVARSVSTTGRRRWLSAVARPWPGRCFSTGRTPPAISPCGLRARERRDLLRRRAEGTVADHARRRRQPARRPPECNRHRCRPRADPAAISRPPSRAASSPVRRVALDTARHRPHPADRPANAAARAAAPGRLPDRPEPAHRGRARSRNDAVSALTCAGTVDIALEQDQAERVGRAQKGGLVRLDAGPRYSADECARRHRRGLTACGVQGSSRAPINSSGRRIGRRRPSGWSRIPMPRSDSRTESAPGNRFPCRRDRPS